MKLCCICNKHPRYKRQSRCYECHNAWRRENYKENTQKFVETMRAYRLKRKLETLAAYGSRCVCCGETNVGFLTIDHIDGGGNAHRRLIGLTKNFYDWLKKNNYPDDYQILCFNCNCGRAHNFGICPHEKEYHMGHSFEQARPDHQIFHKHIPEGHAHLDEKFDKANRAPILGQLPMGGETVAPELEPGVGTGEGRLSGGGGY